MTTESVRRALHRFKHRPHLYVSTLCRHERHAECVDGPDLRQCRVCWTTCLCYCHKRAMP
jgi:hypothetical protein